MQKKGEKVNIEEHRRFMDNEVQPFLKPLMIDILRKRPTNVLDYIVEWCQSKGQEIQKGRGASRAASEPVPEGCDEVAQQKIRQSIQELEKEEKGPISSDEEDDYLPEETEEERAKMNQRLSMVKKKKAISAETDGCDDSEFVPPVIEKTAEQIEQIKKILRINFMFANLEAKDQEGVVGAMEIRTHQENDTIIKEGDDGNELFVVGSGSSRCTKVINGEEKFLKDYKTGDVFGELALLYNAPRAATITAIEETICYVLDRNTFNKIVKTASIKRREKFEAFLNKIEIFTDLKPDEKSKVCDCLQTAHYPKGTAVINQGDDGNAFFLVQSGTAEAVCNNDGTENKVYDYQENDYFGELALLNSEKRKATVRATSDDLQVAFLDADSFTRLLGPMKDILKRNASRYQKFVETSSD